MKNQPYDFAVDWWSFGVLCFEMLMGFPPFQGETTDATIKRVLNKSMSVDLENNMFRNNSKQVVSFLNGLMEENSIERLGMPNSSLGNIREHPFFGSKLNWEQMENFDSCKHFSSLIKVDVTPFPKKTLNLNELRNILPNIDEKLLKTIDQNVFKEFDFFDERFCE